MSQYRTHIITASSVIVNFDDRVVNIHNYNPVFNKLKDALQRQNFDKIRQLVDIAHAIKEHSSGKFYVYNDQVMIDGELLPEVLSNRLLQYVEQNIPTSSLENFWNNLAKNPSERSRQELYGFLENTGIPLTESGKFIAYKRVTEDFKDLRTKTFDNSPGKIVEIDRSEVDDNPNNTCSRGLHVAAFNYAGTSYGIYGDLGNSNKLVAVEVDPADVVSVPIDYNNSKMRVCRYKVLKEIDYEFKTLVHEEECCEKYSDCCGEFLFSWKANYDCESLVIAGHWLRQISLEPSDPIAVYRSDNELHVQYDDGLENPIFLTGIPTGYDHITIPPSILMQIQSMNYAFNLYLRDNKIVIC